MEKGKRLVYTVLRHTQRQAKKIHHIRKKHPIRSAICVLLFLNLLVIGNAVPRLITPPGLRLTNMPLGLLPYKIAHERIAASKTQAYRFLVRNRVYTYTYADMGVYLDEESILKSLASIQKAPFPSNIIAFLSLQKTIDAPLLFTQEYTDFLRKTVFDFSDGKDIVLWDEPTKQFTVLPQEDRYKINPEAFTNTLNASFGHHKNEIPVPLVQLSSDAQGAVIRANSALSNTFSEPLTIRIETENGETRTVTLTQDDLTKILSSQATLANGSLTLSLDESYAKKVVSDKLHNEGYFGSEAKISEEISRSLTHALEERVLGTQIEALDVKSDAIPNTLGDAASRYIEVDISQQKMFLFDQGKLIKTLRVSTGKDYPTPIGTFTILNKVSNGFSNIYNVWMPWWMGFSYSETLHAYFGIHELPYAIVDGDKIQRPRDFIGTPNTGGCVALDVGDAKWVYDFAPIGTKIVIYE